jgi:hypothetical protein
LREDDFDDFAECLKGKGLVVELSQSDEKKQDRLQGREWWSILVYSRRLKGESARTWMGSEGTYLEFEADPL